MFREVVERPVDYGVLSFCDDIHNMTSYKSISRK